MTPVLLLAQDALVADIMALVKAVGDASGNEKVPIFPHTSVTLIVKVDPGVMVENTLSTLWASN
jgi:hypothetical protein